MENKVLKEYIINRTKLKSNSKENNKFLILFTLNFISICYLGWYVFSYLTQSKGNSDALLFIIGSICSLFLIINLIKSSNNEEKNDYLNITFKEEKFLMNQIYEVNNINIQNKFNVKFNNLSTLLNNKDIFDDIINNISLNYESDMSNKKIILNIIEYIDAKSLDISNTDLNNGLDYYKEFENKGMLRLSDKDYINLMDDIRNNLNKLYKNKLKLKEIDDISEEIKERNKLQEAIKQYK